jgi:hypothetical protein
MVPESDIPYPCIELRYSDYLDYRSKVNRLDLFRIDEQVATELGYLELKSSYFPGNVLTLTEFKFHRFDLMIGLVLDWYGSDGSEFLELDLSSKGELIHRLFSENIVQSSPYAADIGVLLRDPVVYSYAFFRFNNVPVRAYPYQDAILNDNHKRIDVELSNQIGKSFGLAMLGRVLKV